MKGVAMKLYIYDHCPFCVRAHDFGLRDVAVDEEVLLNDDEDMPIGLIRRQTGADFNQARRHGAWARAWILCALLMNMRAKSA